MTALKKNWQILVCIFLFSCVALASVLFVGRKYRILGIFSTHLQQTAAPQKVRVHRDISEYKTTSGKLPQFIVLSFDGSKSLDMWEATRAFARKMAAEGSPVHFSYFMSGVYFLAPQFHQLYQPPKNPVGISPIGFADGTEDTIARVKEVNAAFLEGHDIGSHANGHFDGSRWTRDDWHQELNAFHDLIFDWQQNNQLEQTASTEALLVKPADIVGFRAPLLARNDAMYAALADQGFTYDSSGVATSSAVWPSKNTYGTWLIPMASIPLYGARGSILTMDYNFFMLQSHTREVARRGSFAWDKFHQQMLRSYEQYFDQNYAGSRAPVIIGHHFSTWNDGVYWQVMQDFAQEECKKPEVYCVSFRDLVEYLNSTQP